MIVTWLVWTWFVVLGPVIAILSQFASMSDSMSFIHGAITTVNSNPHAL